VFFSMHLVLSPANSSLPLKHRHYLKSGVCVNLAVKSSSAS
jgi:hypothetical protein